MSFIRAGSEPKWVDDAETEGLYVYSDGEYIVGLPKYEKEFVEVVMRMLDQSGALSDKELESVLDAFGKRFRWGDYSGTYLLKCPTPACSTGIQAINADISLPEDTGGIYCHTCGSEMEKVEDDS